MIFGQGQIPAKYLEYGPARAAILPVPYEGTVSYGKGASRGPAAILRASSYLEWYDEELSRLNFQAGITTVKPLGAEKSPEKMAETVAKACKKLLKQGKFIAMLGGEHSISFGLYRALREKYPDLSVVQIDAHTDLRQELQGSPYSHGCVMRRICETCRRTAQVGIRSLSHEEALFIKENRKAVYFAHQIREKRGWLRNMLKQLGRNVFLTIDIDGLDPSVVPHTGTPEPGGLGWYETLDIIRAVFRERNVVAFDLVELAPTPYSAPSDFLAAKLVYRLIGYKFKSLLRPVA